MKLIFDNVTAEDAKELLSCVDINVEHLKFTEESTPSASHNTGSLQCPFLLVERFADNGEHSHWELIDRSTGAVEWSQQAGT